MVDFWAVWPSQVGFRAQRHSLYGSQELGGLEGRWTPEELLLAAVAGCFTTTLRSISGNDQFDFTDLQVEACGTVRKTQFGYVFSEIVIRPTLEIACSEERERALNILNRAERLCLVSRAIEEPLRFEPKIEVTEPQLSV